MTGEALIYENGKIRITKNVFSNGAGDKFIIANIKSIRDERKSKSIVPMILAAVCVALAGFTDLFAYSRYVFGGLAAFFLVCFILQKESFVIYLTNPQGEVAAFRTKDSAVFRDILRCLKQAIALH